MTEPLYFESSAAWRAWLGEHHATEAEVWVGMWKAHTGRAVVRWEGAVRGIYGVGRRVDDDRKAQRFTPRKSTTWSAKNVRMVAELEAAGLMGDAGRAAFAMRDAAADYAVGALPDGLPGPRASRGETATPPSRAVNRLVIDTRLATAPGYRP
jgi:uncharacterized protein YdeI (YjbR/CyaY-like superfamily)